MWSLIVDLLSIDGICFIIIIVIIIIIIIIIIYYFNIFSKLTNMQNTHYRVATQNIAAQILINGR